MVLKPLETNNVKGSMTHELKTWPEFFSEIEKGNKTFELRKDDRNFSLDDHLLLLEFDPATNEYSGKIIVRQVSYKLLGPGWGLEEGYCILGLK